MEQEDCKSTKSDTPPDNQNPDGHYCNVICKKCSLEARSKCPRCRSVIIFDLDILYALVDASFDEKKKQLSIQFDCGEDKTIDAAMFSFFRFFLNHYSRKLGNPDGNFWTRQACQHDWKFKDGHSSEIECNCFSSGK